MDSSPRMDVAEWQNSPLPLVPLPTPHRGFLPPALVGIVGTVLLHALLIQSVSFASRGPKPKLPESQESANAFSKYADADNLLLISLPTIANASQATSASAISSLPALSTVKIKPDVHVDLPELYNMETLAFSEDQASTPIASGADGAELARLFGIYTGQIQARVARIWRRPRSPVNEDAASQNANYIGESFQCEAQIVQDIKGNVQEIMLPRCNASPAWRNSLVLAIQHASPLPAPPSEKLFSTFITLNFVGLNYFAGAPDDDYEPARRPLLSAQ